jgi:hypothetical protein
MKVFCCLTLILSLAAAKNPSHHTDSQTVPSTDEMIAEVEADAVRCAKL